MKKGQQIKNLRFEPKNQVLAARFTKSESNKIRAFCKKENIKYSDILRYSVKQIIKEL